MKFIRKATAILCAAATLLLFSLSVSAEEKPKISGQITDKYDNIYYESTEKSDYIIAYKDGCFYYLTMDLKVKLKVKAAQVTEMVDGRAWVKSSKTEKWGLIDSNGKFLTKCIYSSVRRFHSGYSVVSKQYKISEWEYETRTGVVDKNGKIVVPIEYSQVSDLIDDTKTFYVVNDNSIGSINTKGEFVIPMTAFPEDIFVGLVTLDNMNTGEEDYDYKTACDKGIISFSQELTYFTYVEGYEELMALQPESSGGIYVPFGEDYFLYEVAIDRDLNIHWDTKRLSRPFLPNSNLASFSYLDNGDKPGIKNAETGDVIVPYGKYEEIFTDIESRAFICAETSGWDTNEYGRWDIFDEYGNCLLTLSDKYDMYTPDCCDNADTGYKDVCGNIYADRCTPLTEVSGVYRIRNKETGKVGLMNLKGKIIVPCKYHWIDEIKNNYAYAYKYDGKNVTVGLVNIKTGNELTDFSKETFLEPGWFIGATPTVVDSTPRITDNDWFCLGDEKNTYINFDKHTKTRLTKLDKTISSLTEIPERFSDKKNLGVYELSKDILVVGCSYEYGSDYICTDKKGKHLLFDENITYDHIGQLTDDIYFAVNAYDDCISFVDRENNTLLDLNSDCSLPANTKMPDEFSSAFDSGYGHYYEITELKDGYYMIRLGGDCYCFVKI